MTTASDSDTTSQAAGPMSWVLASLLAFIAIMPLMTLGLAVPPQLIVPVAVLAGALLAALAATWVRNIFTAGTSSRVLVVVGTTAALSVLVAAIVFLGIMLVPVPILVHLPIAALFLGGIATWAAWRFRSAGRHLVRDLLLSLGLLAAGAAVIMSALYGGCMIITCSAYSGPIE
ncbi:hypothetical protein GCM10028864_17580 [Microlunatus parietis]